MLRKKPSLYVTNLDKLNSIKNLKNYDIIIDENAEESEYRNNGKYIYHNGEAYKLSSYPDDYGTLPQWIELRKEDLGYSYFQDGLIDNNSYVPINFKDWKIGETRFKSDYIKPLGKLSHTAHTLTDFFRKKDGAIFTLEVRKCGNLRKCSKLNFFLAIGYSEASTFPRILTVSPFNSIS